MDYSLLIGMDTQKKEFVCGIIDYLRQYTWDKQIESLVKTSLIPKNQLPTVISPANYKKRFRKFISDHFLTIPDHWCSQLSTNPSSSNKDFASGKSQSHDDQDKAENIYSAWDHRILNWSYISRPFWKCCAYFSSLSRTVCISLHHLHHYHPIGSAIFFASFWGNYSHIQLFLVANLFFLAYSFGQM